MLQTVQSIQKKNLVENISRQRDGRFHFSNEKFNKR